MNPQLSARVKDLASSPIRDILAALERPGLVSFAGGLPSPDEFPQLGGHDIPRSTYQYGPSEGETVLRELLAHELVRRGLDCTTEQVVILNGSQQGIDLVAKLFLDPKTRIAVESPTYLAALQVFKFFGAEFSPLPTDLRGDLTSVLNDCAFSYVIPNFQNPTGKSYSVTERDNLAHACDTTLTTLFEDDPYRELNYENVDTTPVCARLERSSWIYQSSFSKSFAPGLRLGYLVCSKNLVDHFVRLKQAADLHSNRLSQWIVLQQLLDPRATARLDKLRDQYRTKRDVFQSALQRWFGTLASWDTPPGGLFFWLNLDPHIRIDTRDLLAPALERGVAFMPGEPFFATNGQRLSSMRLNFSHAREDEIDRGLRILAQVVVESQSRGRA